MKINKIILLCLCVLLVGCSSSKKQYINYTYVATDQVPAEPKQTDAQAQIAEASSSIGESLQQLSAIQVATHPNTPVPPLNARALGMTRLVTVNWNGPAEPLLKKIAKLSAYQYRSIGEAPAIPLLVSINAHDQVLAEVLRDTTYQVHTKADVLVDPRKKIIELRYHAS